MALGEEQYVIKLLHDRMNIETRLNETDQIQREIKKL
jgi:phage terminase large subunit-like protein